MRPVEEQSVEQGATLRGNRERAAVLPTLATTPTSPPIDYSTPPDISEPAMILQLI